jgi:hypothetical protein
MPRSLDMDSRILFFLSSLLILINCLFMSRKSLGFLSLAACFLLSHMSSDFSASSNLLFLSFGFALGSGSIPCFSKYFMIFYLFVWCSVSVLMVLKSS